MSVLLLLTACGSTDSTVESKEENETSTNAQTDDNEHRIVATTYAIVEFLDALDLSAVGVPTTYKDLPEKFADATISVHQVVKNNDCVLDGLTIRTEESNISPTVYLNPYFRFRMPPILCNPQQLYTFVLSLKTDK